MEPKKPKRLFYEDFQYGSGDIAITRERDVLHLYEVVDSISVSGNITLESFSYQKKNKSLDIHEKLI